MGAENLAPTGILSPNLTALSESLYRLSYPGSLFSGYRGYLMGIKRPGHEVNHSYSSNDQVKNEWRYTYSPTIRLHDVDRDGFALFIVIPTVPHIYADITICQCIQ